MKIIRYQDKGGRIGYAAQDGGETLLEIEGDIFGQFEVTNRKVAVKKVLAPVKPTAILAVGLNYRKHAEEIGFEIPEYPVLFMKSIHAVQNPGDPILLPTHLRSRKVDYECELAVVIGKKCKNVSREDALGYVLGYTCANDVTARDWQNPKRGGGQWCHCKSFDTFAPLGPCLVTKDEIPKPNDLGIRTILNGQVMQESNTGDMIFDVPALIKFLSGSTTLLPGTVILTGTPSGIGQTQEPPVWLQPGDEVTIEIEKVGALTNLVQEEKNLANH